jgi:hypothetical protein
MARFTTTAPGRLLEAHILGRHKFQHFRRWFAGELAPYLRDVIADRSIDMSQWLDMAAVRRMAEAHICGTANHTDEIDKMLTLRATLRTLLQGGGPVVPSGSVASQCGGWRTVGAEVHQ